MSIQGLKEKLYKEIDALDDAAALQILHDAAVDYNTYRNDIVDMLTDEQKNRLEKSIQQSNEGKTITHKEAMELISKWRRK